MRRYRGATSGSRKGNSKLLWLAIFLGAVLSILIGLILYTLNVQGRI